MDEQKSTVKFEITAFEVKNISDKTTTVQISGTGPNGVYAWNEITLRPKEVATIPIRATIVGPAQR